MNKKLFVLSGSSGVGKGTVLKGFLDKNPNFMLSISCTTRKPRQGEVDGVNYFFISNFYGTKKKYINQCLQEEKDIILEIDTQGALQVKKQMPEAVLIFICPPSYETLENRLRGRHTEDEETIQKRLEQVKVELERAEKFDYKIVNDNLEDAINELSRVIFGEMENA